MDSLNLDLDKTDQLQGKVNCHYSCAFDSEFDLVEPGVT